jgi:hypothetical protein
MHARSHRRLQGATVRRLVPLVPTLAVLVLLAAGCGSATNDYRGKVADVQQRYEQQMTELTTRATTDIATNPTAASASFTELAAVVGQFAADVAAIKPPAGKQQLASQLVGAYRTLAQASLDLKAALAASDQAGLQKAIGEFNQATAQESAAVDAFNAAD